MTPAQDFLEVAGRLSVAALVGALIGINRELHNKPAGVKTHALVGLGAAVAVVSVATLGTTADHQSDAMSRVAQGIVTGIGFLGAGVILRDPGDGRVQGLTTAAAIWVTALFGIASGFGAYRELAIGVVLVFLILVSGDPIERALHRSAAGPPNPSDSDGGSKH